MGSYHSFNGNVIDIEASGLASSSYPLEIGIVLGNGESYEALIKPLGHWQHWDSSAQALHGISRQQLLDEGLPATQVCEEINQLCGGKTLYSDCWVYDARWLNLLFAETGTTMQFTCSPIEALLSEHEQRHWWQYKKDFCTASDIRPHRALNDAIIIAETMERRSVLPLQHTPCGNTNRILPSTNANQAAQRSVA